LKRVLITRPEPGATETAERLTTLGFLPIVAPILSIVANDLRAPDSVAATLLTSRNAIAACPRLLHDRPVFAVGAATAKHATEAGFRRVFNADGDAASLIELIADTLSPKNGPLFLPTGQGLGIDLATSLRQRGFRVLRHVAYRIAPAPVLPNAAETALAQGLVAAAMFFSGDSALHFVRLIKSAGLSESVRYVEAVTISERAAVPLKGLPWWRISVAATPNQDAMLVLLK
jgi:uroporphyrinogen-III synthase